VQENGFTCTCGTGWVGDLCQTKDVVGLEAAKIVTLETKTAALESTSASEVTKLANAVTDVGTLQTNVDSLKTNLENLESSQLTSSTQSTIQLNSGLALKSDKTDLSALELTVADKEMILLKNGITADTTLASTVTALETSLAAEKIQVTALKTTLAAEQSKMTALETAVAVLTKKVATINTQCLNDEESSNRRLASKPCGVLQQDTAPGKTSNQVLVQTLTFTGIQASDIASSSKMRNIEMKIAQALDVKASRIKIIKITNTKVNRQRRFLAEENGVELVFEVTIEGDEAAITAKGEELSASGSAIHTAVVAAVASEAGVDASSVSMASTPMVKASPSNSKDLENTAESDTSTTADPGFTPMHVAFLVMAIVVLGGVLCVWKHYRDLAGERNKQKRQTNAKNPTVGTTTTVTIELQSNPMRTLQK